MEMTDIVEQLLWRTEQGVLVNPYGPEAAAAAAATFGTIYNSLGFG